MPPSKSARKTPIKSSVMKKEPASSDVMEFSLNPSDTHHLTQLSTRGLGSLTKKPKVDEKGGLATPQCATNSSKMCILKGVSLENESTTPTLPQGAAAERQHHLQNKDVRRRLNMELTPEPSPPAATSSDGFKTPKAKRSRTKSTSGPVPTLSLSPSPQRSRNGGAVDKSRFDSSLGLLTKRFLGLLQSAENGILDLNQASVTLAVQKRRIYDITNVLEGIGLLNKISKNNIQWKGTEGAGESLLESQCDLTRDLALLEFKENQLDELISSTESHLRGLSEDKRYAYITYNDLKNITEYQDNTVMAVRAPPETKLQVPHPSEGYQIYMKSERGEIEVLLCPEDESSTSPSSVVSSPSSKPSSGFPSPTGGIFADKGRHYRTRNGSSSQMVAQFIDDEEDHQGLLLETVDQNQQQATASCSGIDADGMDLSSMVPGSELFLSLQPPIDGSDYQFTLGDNEGLSSLFDFL